ncbi:hypothetical protein Nmel_004645 [Mimus melanotis]
MESERSQNAPGERGPAGKARHFYTPPRRGAPVAHPAPSEPARDLGALPGALATEHQTCGTDESCAFQERWARGALST